MKRKSEHEQILGSPFFLAQNILIHFSQKQKRKAKEKKRNKTIWLDRFTLYTKNFFLSKMMHETETKVQTKDVWCMQYINIMIYGALVISSNISTALRYGTPVAIFSVQFEIELAHPLGSQVLNLCQFNTRMMR